MVDWNVDLDECERELRQDRLEGVMQAQHERLERATAEILRRAQGRRISVNH